MNRCVADGIIDVEQRKTYKSSAIQFMILCNKLTKRNLKKS